MSQSYSGSCHCSAVQFKITSDLKEFTWCDCSLCRKKNAVMTRVHESDFELLTGEENLSTYVWNTGVAQHHFCKICGIYPFHRKRSDPSYFGINIHCLGGIDYNTIQITNVDGASMSMVE